MRYSSKAATHGEPSYVWRAGQQRRLELILGAAGNRLSGRLLENGCGVGTYMEKLVECGGQVLGLEYDYVRAAKAASRFLMITNAAGEALPYPATALIWYSVTR